MALVPKTRFYDVVIHYKDGKYVVQTEFEAVEKSIEELAELIDNVPTGKTARLLTCNDAAANLKLSKFTNKPFYGSDGVVEITQDGLVYCEKKFYKYANGVESTSDALDYTKVKSLNSKKTFYGLGDAVNNEVGSISTILSKITKLTTSEKTTLKTLLETDADLAKAFAKAPEEMAVAWKLLKDNGRDKLMKKANAIESLMKIQKNSKLKQLGFIDETFAKVKASRQDDGDFASILDDLDNFGKTMASKPSIEFENFNNIISKLTDNNPQNSQAAHWIIQDITQNANEFVGKKWEIEFKVKNLDGNNAAVDVAARDKSKFIEYKWLTSATVNKEDFVREFIKRDLYNPDINSLSQLEWRIKGMKLSKTKALEYLKSVEASSALNNPKIRKLFENFGKQKNPSLSIDDTEDLLIFLDNNNDWYNLIFK